MSPKTKAPQAPACASACRRLIWPDAPTATRTGGIVWKARCRDCGAVVWRHCSREKAAAQWPLVVEAADRKRGEAERARARAPRPQPIPERLALLHQLRAIEGVVAGERPGGKRPYTTRPAGVGPRGWLAHFVGGYLADGIQAWLCGQVDGFILWPGTLRRRDGSTLCVVDADRRQGTRWLVQAEEAGGTIAYLVRGRRGRCHAGLWLQAGVRVGNGKWAHGDLRHLPKTGRGIGSVLRPYPGEAEAIVSSVLRAPTVDRAAWKRLSLPPHQSRRSPSPARAKAERTAPGPSLALAPSPAQSASGSPGRTPPPSVGGTDVDWDHWRAVPVEDVEEGCRDLWLLVAAVDAVAAGGEAEGALRALNASLPCTPLDEPHIAGMVPSVQYWGAQRALWLARRKSSPVRPVTPSPEAQRRRGQASGRARREAAHARDAEVAARTAEGQSAREIARALGVGERTVVRSRSRSTTPESQAACRYGGG